MQLLRKAVFKKCDVGDWITTAIFILLMLSTIFFAIKNIQYEQRLKTKYGNVNLVPSDLKFEGCTL